MVDFDVHHGNGSQDIAFADPEFLYASTHQSPLYPGTGAAGERGGGRQCPQCAAGARGRGRGLPGRHERAHPAGAGGAFRPDFVFISAGFDAHRADPLAELCLHEDDFAWATSEICALADRHCGGRVVSTLEGGYDLAALARSAAAHVRALMEG